MKENYLMKMRSIICSLLFISLLSYIAVETESIIQNNDEEQTIEDQEEEDEEQIIITEEITMNMNPIPEYQNYFLMEGNKLLFGLDEQGPKPIEITDDEDNPILLTDFFIKKNDMYFTTEEIDNTDPENPVVNEIYFKQEKGADVVESITTIPTLPKLSRSQLDNEEFSIKNFDYEGKMCSDVRNESIGNEARFFLVNGFSHFPGIGMYINVEDGLYNDEHMVRDRALYFWPIDKTAVHVSLPPGELW